MFNCEEIVQRPVGGRFPLSSFQRQPPLYAVPLVRSEQASRQGSENKLLPNGLSGLRTP